MTMKRITSSTALCSGYAGEDHEYRRQHKQQLRKQKTRRVSKERPSKEEDVLGFQAIKSFGESFDLYASTLGSDQDQLWVDALSLVPLNDCDDETMTMTMMMQEPESTLYDQHCEASAVESSDDIERIWWIATGGYRLATATDVHDTSGVAIAASPYYKYHQYDEDENDAHSKRDCAQRVEAQKLLDDLSQHMVFMHDEKHGIWIEVDYSLKMQELLGPADTDKKRAAKNKVKKDLKIQGELTWKGLRDMTVPDLRKVRRMMHRRVQSTLKHKVKMQRKKVVTLSSPKLPASPDDDDHDYEDVRSPDGSTSVESQTSEYDEPRMTEATPPREMEVELEEENPFLCALSDAMYPPFHHSSASSMDTGFFGSRLGLFQ